MNARAFLLITLFLLLGVVLHVKATRESGHSQRIHRRQAEDEFEDDFEYEDEEEPLIEEEQPRHKPTSHQAPEPSRNEDKIPATKPAPTPKNSTTLYSRLFATRRPRPPPPRPADKPKPTLPSFIRSRPRLEGSKFTAARPSGAVSKTTSTTTTTTTPRPPSSRSGSRNGKGKSSSRSTVAESTTEGPRRRFGGSSSSGKATSRSNFRRGNAS